MGRQPKHIKKANRLQRLNDEEIIDPSVFLEEFFSNYYLRELREEIWDVIYSALSNDMGLHQSGRARGDVLFLYENLEKLFEAAYLLHRRSSKEKKKAIKISNNKTNPNVRQSPK